MTVEFEKTEGLAVVFLPEKSFGILAEKLTRQEVMDLAHRGGEKPQGERGMSRRGPDGEGERGVPDIVEVDAGDQQSQQLRFCGGLPQAQQRFHLGLGAAEEVGGELHQALGVAAAVLHRLGNLVPHPQLGPVLGKELFQVLSQTAPPVSGVPQTVEQGRTRAAGLTTSPFVALDEHGGERARVGRSRSEERRVGKECRSRWSPYH